MVYMTISRYNITQRQLATLLDSVSGAQLRDVKLFFFALFFDGVIIVMCLKRKATCTWWSGNHVLNI